MKFILGKKLAMTQVFLEDGTAVAVTRVQAGPCQITQVKKDKDSFVQIGFGVAKEKNLSKAQIGHLKDLNKIKFLREFKINKEEAEKINRGDLITVETFINGDKTSVTGVSKGKGFQGVVKRHGFKGSPASHGHKDQLRMPGSIGSTGPQKVFKGTRMGGHMGSDQVTVKNLEIIKIDPENNELFIKGAIPGAKNGYLIIKADGDLQTKEEPVKKEEPVAVEKSEVEIKESVTEKNQENLAQAENKAEEKKEEFPVETEKKEEDNKKEE